MHRFFRFADRTHPALPALLYLVGGALLFAGLTATTQGGFVRAELPPRQLFGTVTLFVLLPAYLLWLVPRQRTLLENALEELVPLARPEDSERVRERIPRLSTKAWIWIGIAGPVLGLGNNPIFVRQMAGADSWNPLDVAFLCASIALWLVVGLVLGWKIPLGRALSRLGEHAEIDLYRLDRLRPIGRVASSDALAVAGAMALSPLQSLDAQFRLGNYWPALLVGVPAGACLLLIPLWGAHRNIARAKRERIAELRSQVSEADRRDIAKLESLTSHLDRVRDLPSWPLDFELVSRLLAYFVIPPIAWVAAALVENFIDSL